MQTKLISAKLDRINSGLLVIFALDTAEKKQTQPVIKLLTGGGSLTKATAAILSSGEFAAGSCETVLLHAPDGFKAERILLVGLGKLTTTEVRKAAGAAVRFAKPRKLRELCIAVPEGLDPLAATRALVEGAYIGDFDPDTYRSDRKDQSIEQLGVLAGSGAKQAAIEAGLREGVILGEAQNFTRSLVNEPGNV
jgi:leucyl aminopeptidase